jgi:hypothetical protein
MWGDFLEIVSGEQGNKYARVFRACSANGRVKTLLSAVVGAKVNNDGGVLNENGRVVPVDLHGLLVLWAALTVYTRLHLDAAEGDSDDDDDVAAAYAGGAPARVGGSRPRSRAPRGIIGLDAVRQILMGAGYAVGRSCLEVRTGFIETTLVRAGGFSKCADGEAVPEMGTMSTVGISWILFALPVASVCSSTRRHVQTC